MRIRKLSGRRGKIALIKRPQAFLVVVKEKSGFGIGADAEQQYDCQNSAAEKIQAAEQGNNYQIIAVIFPDRLFVSALFEVAAAGFRCRRNFVDIGVSGAERGIDTAAARGNHFQFFRRLRGNGQDVNPEIFTAGARRRFQRLVKVLSGFRGQNNNAAAGKSGVVQAYGGQINRPVQTVAVGRHDIPVNGRHQIGQNLRVFGNRRNHKRLAAVNNQPRLHSRTLFQQVDNLVFCPFQAVGSRVFFFHVRRHVQQNHQRILRQQVRHFFFLPARAGRGNNRRDKTAQRNNCQTAPQRRRTADQQIIKQVRVANPLPGRYVLQAFEIQAIEQQRQQQEPQPFGAQKMKIGDKLLHYFLLRVKTTSPAASRTAASSGI